MSYQVLARKWRPRNFSEMVGQDHVLRALVNALDNDRLHHAFLFTGTRGVGKTTLGRILAKSLNCEQAISSTPCGVCSACQEIDQGRFVDLIEVDAASRTKVEDTRELLENVQYAPTRGRFKVYLIDEVHMLSNHSFNALLKTLEEPPPHVKFLLATTDPQKLPVTILSRCLQFNLKSLPVELIVQHMIYILGQENIEFEDKAVHAIARAADGSMRDALSLLDQAIAHGGGKVEATEVHAMLGTIEHHHIENLLRAIISADGAAVMNEVSQVAEKSPDYATLLSDMISLLHAISIAQVVPDAVEDGHVDRQSVLGLADQLLPEDCQLFYQIALLARRDLTLAPDARAGFEMAMLRMLAFRPVEFATGGQQARVAGNRTTTANAQAPTATAESAPQVSQPVNQTQATIAEPVASDWISIVDALNLKAVARELATHSEWVKRDNDKVYLCLDQNFEQLNTASACKRLEQALSDYFGKPTAVDITAGVINTETPAAHQARVDQEKQSDAVSAIREDPFVKELQDAFDADLDNAVIQPTE